MSLDRFLQFTEYGHVVWLNLKTNKLNVSPFFGVKLIKCWICLDLETQDWNKERTRLNQLTAKPESGEQEDDKTRPLKQSPLKSKTKAKPVFCEAKRIPGNKLDKNIKCKVKANY